MLVYNKMTAYFAVVIYLSILGMLSSSSLSIPKSRLAFTEILTQKEGLKLPYS